MKIFCVGRNYVDHAKELNNPIPKQPLIFMKPDTAQLKDGKPFYYPSFTENLHYEVELIVRISGNFKKIEPQHAYKYIDAVSVGIDFTARDVQARCKEKGHPWEVAKAFDHSAVMGEFIPVTAEQLKDGMGFSLKRNGEKVQDGHTKDMIFPIDHLISYISGIFTIRQGDYIYTGTPAGVGPSQIGDHFAGFIGDQKLLDFEVK